MVAGHLQEKKGLFYIVLNYKNEEGNRKSKWIATGLPVKGNKKRAESMLMDARKNFELKTIEKKKNKESKTMKKILMLIRPYLQIT
ncbi:hypothetical protein [Paenibacillus sp. 7541]|uniref:hypothetical protein n=1 Tax=Paenibacillus sp. 7541 TaxID=2026236 RepID=UPI001C3EDCB0|nr:hypothetical protein [Paenibacillus sp. 7541]